MTPAQQAREFAAEKGFVITPVGKRYKCVHTESGTEFERGSYTALLNEMHAVHNCAHPLKVSDVVDVKVELTPAPPATTLTAAGLVLSSVENVPPVSVNEFKCDASLCEFFGDDWPVKSFDEITADIKIGVQQIREMSSPEVMAERQRHVDALWDMEVRKLQPDVLLKLAQMATGATLDKIARAKGWPARASIPLQTDQKYRNLLLYGFEDGPDATITKLDVLSRISVKLDEHDDRIPVFSYSIPVASGKGLDEIAAQYGLIRADPYNWHAVVEYVGGTSVGLFKTRPEAVTFIRQHLSGKFAREHKVTKQSINRVGQ